MTEPVWIRDEVVVALHDRQLAEHGGASGVRDRGLVESALNAPKNLFHYERADLATLAAAYAFSVASNHPFVDGNKRTAYVCMRLFLRLNGHDFVADKTEKTQIILRLAAGEVSRDELASWLRERISGLSTG